MLFLCLVTLPFAARLQPVSAAGPASHTPPAVQA